MNDSPLAKQPTLNSVHSPTANLERLAASEKLKKVGRVLQFEGPRGIATRTSVYMRYVSYFLLICLVSALVEALTRNISRAGFAGQAMFFSCAFMCFVGAAGTVFFANQRHEIIEQVRHYVFGIAVFPGLALAVFMWAAQGFLSNQSGDVFAGTVSYTLPILYAATVFIPAIVFVKTIAGMRTLHRTKADDQEMVATWTRQTSIHDH